MKKEKKLITPILTIALLVIAAAFLVWPSIYEQRCKSRVYEDMESALSSIESSNVRIIAVSGSEEEGFGYSAGATRRARAATGSSPRVLAASVYQLKNSPNGEFFS